MNKDKLYFIGSGNVRRHITNGYAPTPGVVRTFCGFDIGVWDSDDCRTPVCKRCERIVRLSYGPSDPAIAALMEQK